MTPNPAVAKHSWPRPEYGCGHELATSDLKGEGIIQARRFRE